MLGIPSSVARDSNYSAYVCKEKIQPGEVPWLCRWRGDLNMPMHKQACTSKNRTGSVTVMSYISSWMWGAHTHKREKQCVTGWNRSAMTTAAPSLSCRKEQKKVRERERRRKSRPSNTFLRPCKWPVFNQDIQAIVTQLWCGKQKYPRSILLLVSVT